MEAVAKTTNHISWASGFKALVQQPEIHHDSQILPRRHLAQLVKILVDYGLVESCLPKSGPPKMTGFNTFHRGFLWGHDSGQGPWNRNQPTSIWSLIFAMCKVLNKPSQIWCKGRSDRSPNPWPVPLASVRLVSSLRAGKLTHRRTGASSSSCQCIHWGDHKIGGHRSGHFWGSEIAQSPSSPVLDTVNKGAVVLEGHACR